MQNDNLNEIVEKYKEKDTSKGFFFLKKKKVCFHHNSNLFVIVIVIFQAIGNAPILKQKVFKLTASNKFQTVIQFLRKELRYKGSDPLVNIVFYVVIINNNCFI